MTLKEIETQLKKEGKIGYAKIRICDGMADKHILIGYFEDIANYHGISYERTEVEFIEYVGCNR